MYFFYPNYFVPLLIYPKGVMMSGANFVWFFFASGFFIAIPPSKSNWSRLHAFCYLAFVTVPGILLPVVGPALLPTKPLHCLFH